MNLWKCAAVACVGVSAVIAAWLVVRQPARDAAAVGPSSDAAGDAPRVVDPADRRSPIAATPGRPVIQPGENVGDPGGPRSPRSAEAAPDSPLNPRPAVEELAQRATAGLALDESQRTWATPTWLAEYVTGEVGSSLRLFRANVTDRASVESESVLANTIAKMLIDYQADVRRWRRDQASIYQASGGAKGGGAAAIESALEEINNRHIEGARPVMRSFAATHLTGLDAKRLEYLEYLPFRTG